MERLFVKIKHLPLLSTVNTHFDPFLPSTYKLGTVYTFAYRGFQIRPSWTKLHSELAGRKKVS